MSCENGVCYKASNNKYFGCPPRMADGRHFTDYRGSCFVNNSIRVNNEVFNSYQYRMFMEHNAQKMMVENRTSACKKNCCGPCKEPFETGTMLPEKTIYSCDKNKCSQELNDPNGLGMGTSYSKTLPGSVWGYDTNTFSKVSKNCCSTPQDDFKYYSDKNAKFNSSPARLTVPSGGEAMMGGDPSHYN